MRRFFLLTSVILLFLCCGCAEIPDPVVDVPDPGPVIVISKPVADKNDWRLLLVNNSHPLEAELSFTPKAVKLGYAPAGYTVDERIYSALEQLFAAAAKEGIELYTVSGYRSVAKQESLYNNKISYYMGKGYSKAEATRLTEEVLTRPGCSEHHTGLAMDITDKEWVKQTGGTLEQSFGDTKAGKWLASHCAEYGFVIRYPESKEAITKISYEPWHLRFVGIENAKYMTEHNLCLEEYIELLGE